jgi:hypothetical protein
MVGPRQDLEASERVSRQFLDWLDEGANSNGQRYLEVRRRLELYFDRKNCVEPAELADETLNRVGKKLKESGAVTEVRPLQYCYIAAKLVFLETLSGEKRSPFHRPLNGSNPSNNSGQVGTGLQTDSAPENNGKIAGRLEECLKNLPNVDRELFVDYYRGKPLEKAGNRAALATRLGLTANALSIRACRVRQKLETCIHASQKKHEV